MDDSSQELVRSKQKKKEQVNCLQEQPSKRRTTSVLLAGMSQVRAEMIEVVVRLLDAWPTLSSKTPAKQTQSCQSSQGKTKRCTKKNSSAEADTRSVHATGLEGRQGWMREGYFKDYFAQQA